MRSRPLPVTLAAILLALFGVLNLLAPLFPTEGIPAVVVYLAVVVGVVGLLGAAGLWMLRKWGIWLTTAVCVLNILSAASRLTESAKHRLASRCHSNGRSLCSYHCAGSPSILPACFSQPPEDPRRLALSPSQ
jgi:hypothetical protein